MGMNFIPPFPHATPNQKDGVFIFGCFFIMQNDYQLHYFYFITPSAAFARFYEVLALVFHIKELVDPYVFSDVFRSIYY